MPEPALFLNGFNVRKKQTFAGYEVKSIEISHESIVQWTEYHYPMNIILIWKDKNSTPTRENFTTMLEEFKTHVSKERIIHSQSGRPYDCIFIWPKVSDLHTKRTKDYRKVRLICTGYARRVSQAVASTIENK